MQALKNIINLYILYRKNKKNSKMTDRKQTYEQYLNACESHKKTINPMITTVFDGIIQTGPKIK
jgi:hypothetical protein